MTTDTIIKKIAGLNGFTIESVYEERVRGYEAIIIRGHLDGRMAHRCPHCEKICPGYDTKSEYRRWRALDAGTVMVFIEAPIRRIECPEHGVVTELVPWARHKSRFTRPFEDMVMVKMMEATKKAISEEMRIDWHTVGDIVSRIAQEKLPKGSELFNGLRFIGVDETSYKKGHKYITIVINHETNEVIFAKEGHDKETFSAFFELLTEEQRKSIQLVTGDGARWIKSTMEKYIPWATFCLDRFHVTEWAIESMDEVRKGFWKEELTKQKSEPKRGRGRPKNTEDKAEKADPKFLSRSKYALGKNPENLTAFQEKRLDEIQVLYPKLFRAYQLKEALRNVFDSTPETIETALTGWLNWACRSRIPAIVKLSKKIRRHREAIIATVVNHVSNARVESINNKIKCLIRRSYGFRNVQNMIDLIKIMTSRVKLEYPGRERKYADA